MILHTFKNEEQGTRATVHELTDKFGKYYRVVLVDTDSGLIVGAQNYALQEVAMRMAAMNAEGKAQPGDSIPIL